MRAERILNMDINFKGYGENAATFLADSSVKAGYLVTMKSNGTVKAATSGNDFIGVCLSVCDGYAVVQLSGYVEAKVSSAIALGVKSIVPVSYDTVDVSQNGRSCIVVYSDSNTAGFII